MAYDFSLDKKRTVILLSSFSLLGGALFLAGLLVGVSLRVSAGSHSEHRPQPLAEPKSAPAVPAGLVATTSQLATPLQNKPATDAPESSATGQAGSDAALSTPPASRVPTGASAPSSLSPNASQPPDSSAAGSSQNPAVSQKAYSIQMGAFLDLANAARLVNDLKGRGYKPSIFKAVDARGRLWEAVRMGRFDNLRAALQAATEFREKEQLLALVRPANTL